jgi:hypothetical protein
MVCHIQARSRRHVTSSKSHTANSATPFLARLYRLKLLVQQHLFWEEPAPYTRHDYAWLQKRSLLMSLHGQTLNAVAHVYAIRTQSTEYQKLDSRLVIEKLLLYVVFYKKLSCWLQATYVQKIYKVLGIVRAISWNQECGSSLVDESLQGLGS